MDAIKSLLRRKIITILFIAQVFISMNGIIYYVMYNSSLNQYNVKVSSVKGDDLYIRNNEDSLSGPNARENRKLDLVGLTNFLNNNSYIESWGVNNCINIKLNQSNVDEIFVSEDIKRYFIDMFSNNKAKGGSIGVNIRFINEGYNNIEDYDIISGENLSNVDFHTEGILPVILGNKFKDIFKVGDIIPLKNVIGFDLKVKGIRAKSGYNFEYVEENKASLTEEDYFMIIPLPKDYEDDYMLKYGLYKGGILLKFKNDVDVENNIKRIDDEIDDIFMSGKTYPIKLLAQNRINEILRDGNRKLFIDIILVILCIISLASFMFLLIRNRKGEFGIRFATGYTKNMLYLLVLKENLYVIIIAILINIIYYYNTSVKIYIGARVKGVNSVLNNNMDIGILGVSSVLGIIFIITSLISFVGIYKLNDMNIVDMTKGE